MYYVYIYIYIYIYISIYIDIIYVYIFLYVCIYIYAIMKTMMFPLFYHTNGFVAAHKIWKTVYYMHKHMS